MVRAIGTGIRICGFNVLDVTNGICWNPYVGLEIYLLRLVWRFCFRLCLRLCFLLCLRARRRERFGVLRRLGGELGEGKKGNGCGGAKRIGRGGRSGAAGTGTCGAAAASKFKIRRAEGISPRGDP